MAMSIPQAGVAHGTPQTQAYEAQRSIQQDHRGRRGKDGRQSISPVVRPVAGADQKEIPGLNPHAVAFYQTAMRLLQRAGIPFMAGGAYALRVYTGITRHTKDFDIFLLPRDVHAALAVFDAAGYRTKMQADYWLAKVYDSEHFVDLIFGAGNGVARVDEVWLEHAPEAEVFGMQVKLAPPEETIWSKSFVMERERYDGADVAHLLLRCADQLDWNRLLARFGENWPVLLSHLVLFGFIFPDQRDRVPHWVTARLLGLAQHESHAPAPEKRVCNGTLLSRQQYLVDVCESDYQDGRLAHGYMSPRQIEEYTAGIRADGSPQDEEQLSRLESELHEKFASEKPAPTLLPTSDPD